MRYMKANDHSQIEMELADTIIDRPKGFSAGRRHFLLYPPTLFTVYLTQRIVKQLEIDTDNLKYNPFAEAIRIVHAHKDDVCLLIAYFTLHTKERCYSKKLLSEYANYFKSNIDDDDLSSLLIICLTWDKTDTIADYYKINDELKRMNDLSQVKEANNTFTFCGKTVYGTIIAAAAEKFGWTYDYIVFGISYANLSLMLKDCIKSVYLSDEEAKKAHVNNASDCIDGNDENAVMAAIMSGKWS